MSDENAKYQKGLEALKKLQEKLKTMPMAEFERALMKFNTEEMSMSKYTRGTPVKLSDAIRDGISNYDNDPDADSVDTLVEMINASVEAYIKSFVDALD